MQAFQTWKRQQTKTRGFSFNTLHGIQRVSKKKKQMANIVTFEHVFVGKRLGKVAALFPVMYLSGGTCVMLIITGGGTLKLLFNTLCDSDNGNTCSAHALTGAEWFLVFTCAAILVAQLPNLNSMAMVSLVGAVTSITYCTLFWVLSVKKGRPSNVSYKSTLSQDSTAVAKISDVLNAIGIIVLAYRGHNVLLEIQASF